MLRHQRRETLTASLTVWDCTTGKELRSLSVAAGGVTSIIIDGVPSEMLRWSPTGHNCSTSIRV